MEQASTWRVAIAGFSHMHAGDQIRLALEHPSAVLVGLWDDDAARITPLLAEFDLDEGLVFGALDSLLDDARPDIVVVCSTTQEHRAIVEAVAARGVHVMLEKPFAVRLTEADAMIAAAERGGATLSLNWPLAWYPVHRTTRRLVAEGLVGDIREIHYYDGNRGPLNHVHDKKSVDAGDDEKTGAWWYSAAQGGGSLLDYLGYGATLTTWMRGGETPSAVLAKTFVPPGLEVDEQSVVVATYPHGLSVLQTRWGTFTDPWTIQPFPRCGFVVVGTEGTILSEDYADHVTVQTREHPEPRDIPVDVLRREESHGLAYLIDRLTSGLPLEGPSSWQISRAGQQIVDAAAKSAATGREVELEN